MYVSDLLLMKKKYRPTTFIVKLSIRISVQFTKSGLFVDYLHGTTKLSRV